MHAVAEARKVFHLHIPKTAGTAVNSWLDTTVHHMRARPPGFMRRWRIGLGEGRFGDPRVNPVDQAEAQSRYEQMATQSLRWFDVLHGHVDLTPSLPPGSVSFTILRDPIDRALSQYRDYHRLRPRDYAHKLPEARLVHEAARELPFADFAERMQETAFFRVIFENGMCRTLTRSFLGFDQFNALAPEEIAARAWDYVSARLEPIGLVEDLDRALTAVSERIGAVPPAGPLPHRNDTRSVSTHDARDREAARRFVPADLLFYEKVAAACPVSRYDEAAFEVAHAGALGQRLRPYRVGDGWVFDMNMAIFANGLHGRDAAGTADCCVWSGPGPRSVLYMPVPAGAALELFFEVQGWVDEGLRAGLRLRLDGQEVAWRYEARPDLHGAVVALHRTARPWTKVEFLLPETRTDADCGRDSGDRRRKGLNLRRYGYRPVL